MASENLLKESIAIFNQKNFADLVVRCKDQVWYCHRVILCSRCPHFTRLTTGDGPEYKLDLHNVDCDAVEQILRYLYTFETPDLEPYPVDQWEANRTKIWTDAILLLSTAKKYELCSLANEAYEVLLRHASRLCRRWDEFDVKRKTARLQLSADVWTRFPASGEMRPLKDLVLKGLVKVSDKIAEYEELQEILETKVAFTVDYVKALSARKGRVRVKVEPPTY